ncbi:Kinesin-like protein kif18a [Bulinus truncatus]|nr:Kinesin-like protein kif18a [Bulinus truncatus]
MLPVENAISNHTPEPGNANVKVVIRIRPMNEAESNEKHYTVTEAISDHMLVFDPKIQVTPGFLNTNRRDITRRRFKDLKYAFDYVFGPTATNKAVFEQTTKGIITGVLNGYNCSVFAYGATGAGKTHTMLGNEREPGVIYHTMIDLYKKINEQKEEKLFDVAVSYSEVYNEQVRDLLMPRGNLPIREDKNVGVIIAGLSLHKPKTADELLHMLQFGNKNRTQHPTDANAESSRSHAVFQVFVNQREKSANVSTEVKMAKMCLVDLAGSERANHTTNRGDRFREGANINRSLLALGNVINALADNKFKGHIPYRDSKLTRLLKDSLGGNCQTVMIAAVSPSSRSFEDTYNTLRYADRAKHIRADLKKNVMNVDLHIANYKKYVQELEKENQELRKARQKLSESLEKGDAGTVSVVSPIIRQYQERLKDLFKARREMRRAQMESEGAKRELKWKVIRKERAIKRVQMLTASPSVIGKHKRVIERMKKRIAKEESALAEAAHRIHEHDSAIYNTYSSITSSLSDGKQTSEVLDLNVRIHTVESNLYDSHMYLAFVKKMARAQELQAAGNEKLISCLLQLVKKQHDILHSQDLLNYDLREKYEQCCYLVEERGVSWNSPGPPPDVMSLKSGKEEVETDEISISEIIDIQIPKLQIQALHVDPTKLKADMFSQLKQQPQRVVKPMSAVKPASRSQQPGQNFESGERNIKSSLGANMNHEDVMSSQPYTSSAIDVAQNKMDGSSAVQGNHGLSNNTKQPTSHSPHETTSVSGLSFEDNTLVPTESVSGEKVFGSQASAKDTKSTAGPSSSLPNIGTVPLAKICLFGKSEFKQLSDTASQNSSTDNVNDTFQVLKPALLNTPCIDKQLPKASAMTPSQLLSDINKPKLLPIEKLAHNRKTENKVDESPNQSPNAKDVKPEIGIRVSPVSRHHLKSPGSTLSSNSWTPKSDKDEKSSIRRTSTDLTSRQNKPKASSLTQMNNRPNSSSPLIFNRQSPTFSKPPVGSYVISCPAAQKPNIPESAVNKDKWKPVVGHCINANNVNSFSSYPRTYTDVVESPVISRVNGISPKMTLTPVINNWVGEPMEGIMRTPNFNPYIENVISSLRKKDVSITDLLTLKSEGDASEFRQPLRLLSTNTSITNTTSGVINKPVVFPEQAPSLDCIVDPTCYKIRSKHFKSRRQNRQLSSNPYSLNTRKARLPSPQELSVDSEQSESSESSETSCPNYMQPTFARAQKMLGITLDKPVRREANNPLSRRTLTNRYPQSLLSNYNKSYNNNSSQIGWRI